MPRDRQAPMTREPERGARVGSVDDHHVATVLRPRGLVRADHRRTLLAVADGGNPPGLDAKGRQILLGGGGAALAERQVVLARAALVAVTLDGHGVLRILLQPLGPLLDLRAGVGPQ